MAKRKKEEDGPWETPGFNPELKAVAVAKEASKRGGWIWREAKAGA